MTQTEEFEVMKDFVKADERGRLVLGETIKNQQFRVLRNEEGEMRLIPVVTIPAREVWLYRNSEAMASVMRGLDQARAGKVTKKGPDLDAANALAADLEDSD